MNPLWMIDIPIVIGLTLLVVMFGTLWMDDHKRPKLPPRGKRPGTPEAPCDELNLTWGDGDE